MFLNIYSFVALIQNGRRYLTRYRGTWRVWSNAISHFPHITTQYIYYIGLCVLICMVLFSSTWSLSFSAIVFVSSSWVIYEWCCARSKYQGQGQVITSNSPTDRNMLSYVLTFSAITSWILKKTQKNPWYPGGDDTDYASWMSHYHLSGNIHHLRNINLEKR